MYRVQEFIAAVAACFLIFVASQVLSAQTPTPSPAATPPPSDILVVDLKYKGGELQFGDPKKITSTAGYNNQPAFLNQETILYTSYRGRQTDIYRYDLKSGATSQFTDTAESEYSPTLTPDRKNVSVVRVEADGTQRLWKFPLAGGAPALVLENIKPVGYHHWIDGNTLALFVLGGAGKPHTLQIADMRTGKSEVISENPGRILRKVPNRNQFSFVHKISDQHWEIKAFDLRARTIASLIATLPGVEDYVWLPDGRLLMGKDSKLFAVIPLTGRSWQEVADLSRAGIKRITRLAADAKGNRLAIVGVVADK
jgi:hypothetical protein